MCLRTTIKDMQTIVVVLVGVIVTVIRLPPTRYIFVVIFTLLFALIIQALIHEISLPSTLLWALEVDSFPLSLSLWHVDSFSLTHSIRGQRRRQQQ